MKTLLGVAVGGVAVVMVSACGGGGGLCDKNASVNLDSKGSACGAAQPLLMGEKAACTSKLSSCNSVDQAALTKTLDCLSKLQACVAGGKDIYLAGEKSCFDPLTSLSKVCSDAYFGGVIPGQDAGTDAGVIDAGPQPLNDGGSALEFIAVADEYGYAFAWTQLQPGFPAKWLLIGTGDGGVRDPEVVVTPGNRIAFDLTDAGQSRRFFIVGVDPMDHVVFGDLDAGMNMVDAGPIQCLGPIDCPTDKVCDLNTCKTQACLPAMDTCPNGYVCIGNHCNRTFSDGGVFDAGMLSGDAGTAPRPFISNEVAVSLGVPQFSGGVHLGGFPGRRPDMVAIDSARVFIALEQEGQLIGHTSYRHGRDFGTDLGTTSNIDTVGSRLKATYNPESQTIYVCYNVGRGVRVRKSNDFGTTWVGGTTIEPFDDGGLTSKFTDCDIAPWKNGGALMVTVDDDGLAVRTVSTGLSVGDPDIAFLSSGPDAGNVYNPARPAIATLPTDSIVHVTFTGLRTLASLVVDSEGYGVYRDGALGVFTQPKFLNPGINPSNPGTSFPQDYTTVVADPKTKRAVAAYTSLETGPGGGTISTVYSSLWFPATKTWQTGSDLNVFAIDPRDNNTTLLFPGKLKNDIWDAFSPIFGVSPSGKMFLSVAAGPRTGLAGDYRMYVTGFDFDAQSPGGTARGWYVGKMAKASQTRVINPGNVASTAPPTVTAFGADSQLTTYGALIEGLGASGDVEGLLTVISRP